MAMNTDWPIVKLESCMSFIDDQYLVDASDMYPNFGIYSFGRGLFHKQPISGTATSAKFLRRVTKGQFIYSRLFAFEGAYGMVTDDFDGHFVSMEYPTFVCDPKLICVEYLSYYFKQPPIWRTVAVGSKGLGGRRQRVQPDQILAHEIPLPPIAEQHRIVSRLDNLVGKVNQARQLRTEADEETASLSVSMSLRAVLTDKEKAASGWRKLRLDECITLVDDQHKVTLDGSYPNLGIYSFGKGLFHKPPIEGTSTSAKTLRRVSTGQFIYSRLFAFEGAYGMVTDEFDGRFVSMEYPTFVCDPKQMRIEFLLSYFKHPSVWREVAIGSKGLGDRRQRVQPNQILAHELWVPPMTVQDKIANMLTKVSKLKPFQSETSTELDALVPSLLDRAFKGEL